MNSWIDFIWLLALNFSRLVCRYHNRVELFFLSRDKDIFHLLVVLFHRGGYFYLVYPSDIYDNISGIFNQKMFPDCYSINYLGLQPTRVQILEAAENIYKYVLPFEEPMYGNYFLLFINEAYNLWLFFQAYNMVPLTNIKWRYCVIVYASHVWPSG